MSAACIAGARDGSAATADDGRDGGPDGDAVSDAPGERPGAPAAAIGCSGEMGLFGGVATPRGTLAGAPAGSDGAPARGATVGASPEMPSGTPPPGIPLGAPTSARDASPVGASAVTLGVLARGATCAAAVGSEPGANGSEYAAYASLVSSGIGAGGAGLRAGAIPAAGGAPAPWVDASVRTVSYTHLTLPTKRIV